jgi:hypothetical protein
VAPRPVESDGFRRQAGLNRFTLTDDRNVKRLEGKDRQGRKKATSKAPVKAGKE